ncbi:MAG: hypothetical protein AB8U25_03120 [Rickettsiales endosymbiont of Dermacentor nuttalli]
MLKIENFLNLKDQIYINETDIPLCRVNIDHNVENIDKLIIRSQDNSTIYINILGGVNYFSSAKVSNTTFNIFTRDCGTNNLVMQNGDKLIFNTDRLMQIKKSSIYKV